MKQVQRKLNSLLIFSKVLPSYRSLLQRRLRLPPSRPPPSSPPIAELVATWKVTSRVLVIGNKLTEYLIC
jgi:hypothetical protein